MGKEIGKVEHPIFGPVLSKHPVQVMKVPERKVPIALHGHLL
jgi:hypothetical protein